MGPFYELVMYQLHVPVLPIWVQTEFMVLVLQAFHALKSHTDQKGFVRYATISQLMPTSTAALPVNSKLSTFHSLNAFFFFTTPTSFFGNYSALREGLVIHTPNIA